MFLVSILFGAGYWYYRAEAVCDVPIAYRIGTVDSRFGLSFEEVREHISNAESLWEDATGRNLFTYDETAKFSINFIFDNRQASANAEADLREVLEEHEWESQTVKEQYENLVSNYEYLKSDYEAQSATYEKRLQEHNAEVEKWNKEGGAPEDVYAELSNKQQALKKEQEQLNAIAYELNQLVREMNKISEKGNAIISDYNEVVEEYNTQFTEGKEFTQGDYRGDVINIYEYSSLEELDIVLMHEFGHALSLDHVEGEESVMYHFMEAQTLQEGLTSEDIEAFEATCGDEKSTLWSVL